MATEAETILQEVFGYESFRPFQREIIGNVLKKKDTLGILPTGGGKSLCYQIPSLIFDGLTVVVSPLISLMKDQVEQLHSYDIPAVYLNSTLDRETYRFNVEQVKRGEASLLYVAPETLLKPRTLSLLDSCRVDCLTVDEAHCISEWGHDFRPEYRQLADIRNRFPDAVCLGLTATATPRVQQDIAANMKLDDADLFIASFNRKNLFLEIADKREPLHQTLEFLNKHRDQSGIIYCFSRRQVDELYADIEANGFSALPYHAGLTEAERNRNQEAFIRDDVQIIVATIAFGMGIDKPDVRFVMHYDMPQNIEAYYQQIGRAGRDGLRADCLMLFNYGDVRKIRYFINQKEGKERRVAEKHLQDLLALIETRNCRRILLLGYFGEAFEKKECGICDNCVSDPEELEDLTVAAQKFLSCMARTGQIFGSHHIIRVLRGSKAQKVLKQQHDRLSTYGIGKEYSTKQWQQIFRELMRQDIVQRNPDHGSLHLTSNAKGVLQGEEKVYGRIDMNKLKRRSAPASKDAEELDYNPELFQLLKTKRKQMADKRSVPPYVIFPDTTLIEMAYFYPQTRESLLAIHGIGKTKMKKYGPSFLDIIQGYCTQNGLAERVKSSAGGSRAATPAVRRSNRRYHKVGEAFNKGESVADISDRLNVKKGTVIGHLQKFAREDRTLREEGLKDASSLSEEQMRKVVSAFEELGDEFLRPIFDHFEEQIPYDELKVARLYYQTLNGPSKNETRQ